MYALVDCNNFYASVQRLFDPSLIGKPIIVLSNNDGCVIARSNEAKEIGIKMGAVFHQITETIIQYQVNVFSSNYPLLGDMSSRVMSMLSEFTPDFEIYSIDEAFLQFKGYDRFFNYYDIGKEIRRKIWKGLGIPVSVGIAPTKSLAKCANKFAKKYPELGGHVCVLDSQDKIDKALKKTEIGDVWGIGRRLTKRLKAIGVNSAYDFVKLNTLYIESEFGVVGKRLHRDLSGIPTIGPEEVKAKKIIANTRSFANHITTKEELAERIATFAVTGSESLRKQKTCSNLIGVFLQTNPFRQDLPQYSPFLAFPTDFPTSSSLEIVKFALRALDKIYKPGYHYKKAGVMMMEITPEEIQQLNIFTEANPKHKALMKTIDAINQKVGKDKVLLGIQKFEKNKKWGMRQEYLSPCYTTRINDIPKLNCN